MWIVVIFTFISFSLECVRGTLCSSYSDNYNTDSSYQVIGEQLRDWYQRSLVLDEQDQDIDYALLNDTQNGMNSTSYCDWWEVECDDDNNIIHWRMTNRRIGKWSEYMHWLVIFKDTLISIDVSYQFWKGVTFPSCFGDYVWSKLIVIRHEGSKVHLQQASTSKDNSNWMYGELSAYNGASFKQLKQLRIPHNVFEGELPDRVKYPVWSWPGDNFICDQYKQSITLRRQCARRNCAFAMRRFRSSGISFVQSELGGSLVCTDACFTQLRILDVRDNDFCGKWTTGLRTLVYLGSSDQFEEIKTLACGQYTFEQYHTWCESTSACKGNFRLGDTDCGSSRRRLQEDGQLTQISNIPSNKCLQINKVQGRQHNNNNPVFIKIIVDTSHQSFTKAMNQLQNKCSIQDDCPLKLSNQEVLFQFQNLQINYDNNEIYIPVYFQDEGSTIVYVEDKMCQQGFQRSQFNLEVWYDITRPEIILKSQKGSNEQFLRNEDTFIIFSSEKLEHLQVSRGILCDYCLVKGFIQKNVTCYQVNLSGIQDSQISFKAWKYADMAGNYGMLSNMLTLKQQKGRDGNKVFNLLASIAGYGLFIGICFGYVLGIFTKSRAQIQEKLGSVQLLIHLQLLVLSEELLSNSLIVENSAVLQFLRSSRWVLWYSYGIEVIAIYLSLELVVYIGLLITCERKSQDKLKDLIYYRIQNMMLIAIIPGIYQLTKLSYAQNGYGNLAFFLNILCFFLLYVWMLHSYFKIKINTKNKSFVQEYICACQHQIKEEQQFQQQQHLQQQFQKLWIFLIIGLAMLSSILCGIRKSQATNIQVSLVLDVAWLGYFCYMCRVNRRHAGRVQRQEILISSVQVFYWFFMLMFLVTRIRLFLSLILGTCVIILIIFAYFNSVILFVYITQIF